MGNKISIIKWADSYGVTTGWMEIDKDYKPELLIIYSAGVKIYEDDYVVAVAANYSNETEYTPRQANGIMVIPKKCIISIDEV